MLAVDSHGHRQYTPASSIRRSPSTLFAHVYVLLAGFVSCQKSHCSFPVLVSQSESRAVRLDIGAVTMPHGVQLGVETLRQRQADGLSPIVAMDRIQPCECLLPMRVTDYWR